MMKRWRGVLTVEAALVLPLFIFLIVGFLYYMQVLMLQEKIQASITEVGKFASRYGYVYQQLENGEEGDSSFVESLVTKAAFQLKFLEYIELGNLSDSCIVGGIYGVSLLESTFMEEDAEIEVVAHYIVKIPVMFFEYFPFVVKQTVKTRGFVGQSCVPSSENGAEKDATLEVSQEVYGTPAGAKYHKNMECTYLKMKVTSVSGDSIEGKRNESGGKYYPCESCHKESSKEGTYYITAYGDRYHTIRTCNRIERTIITMKLDEVGNRTPCSKCSQ